MSLTPYYVRFSERSYFFVCCISKSSVKFILTSLDEIMQYPFTIFEPHKQKFSSVEKIKVVRIRCDHKLITETYLSLHGRMAITTKIAKGYTHINTERN